MKFTVSKKILSGFGLLIAIIICMGSLSLHGISRVNNMLNTLYEKELVGISLIKEAQISMISSQRAEKNLILSNNLDEQSEFSQNLRIQNGLFEENIEKFKSTIVTDETREDVAQLENLWDQVKEQQEKVILLNSQNKTQEAFEASLQNRENVDKLEEIIDKIATEKDGLGQKDYNESNIIYTSLKQILITAMIMSIFVAIITAYYVSRVISKPIVAIANSASRIANGDLTVESIKVKNKDEIRELADSFNIMTNNLRNIIEKVVNSSQVVASYSQELSAAAEETTAATEQVTNSILQVADGANKQSEELEEASVSLEQISTTIQQAAVNTESVVNASLGVSNHANLGVKEIENAVDKIEVIKQVSLNTGDVVRDLGKQSEKISEIVDVIKNIANQTNLLALNASIEAARAGEQGRGFAVVADEVTKLAEESSMAAEEVAKLIKNIQDKTSSAVNIIDEGNKNIYDGVNAVNKAGETFKSIANEIHKTVKQIQQVSGAAEQITNGNSLIVESIQNIAAIAEETAASSQEVTASSEEQTASMEEIAKSSQELANLAQELQSAVSIFKY